MKKMGGIGSMMKMLPGMGQLKDKLEGANIDENALNKQEAIILSMTKKERQHPKLINASRRIRIAKGSGTTVQEVNKILKQQQQMADMMKKFKKMGQKGMMRGGLSQLLGGMR
jgi:signal recognition particle subunit SRP54